MLTTPLQLDYMAPIGVKCSEMTPMYCEAPVFNNIWSGDSGTCTCAPGVTDKGGACQIPSTGQIILKSSSIHSGEKFCTSTVGCVYQGGKCVDAPGRNSRGDVGTDTGNGNGSSDAGNSSNGANGATNSTNTTNNTNSTSGSSYGSPNPAAIGLICALLIAIVATISISAAIIKHKAARARVAQAIVVDAL